MSDPKFKSITSLYMSGKSIKPGTVVTVDELGGMENVVSFLRDGAIKADNDEARKIAGKGEIKFDELGRRTIEIKEDEPEPESEPEKVDPFKNPVASTFQPDVDKGANLKSDEPVQGYDNFNVEQAKAFIDSIDISHGTEKIISVLKYEEGHKARVSVTDYIADKLA